MTERLNSLSALEDKSSARFDLENADRAMELIASRKTNGRIVIESLRVLKCDTSSSALSLDLHASLTNAALP